MIVTLQRLFVVDGAQLGMLTFEGDPAPWCWTLEDEPREVKIAGETCIPHGRYELRLRKFGGLYDRYRVRYPWNEPGMLWLQDVPGFDDVLIHCGNHKNDTRGCVLVGHGAFVYGSLSQSVEAYAELYKRVSAALLKSEGVYLEVRRINEPI
jgi:hypothetical protein